MGRRTPLVVTLVMTTAMAVLLTACTGDDSSGSLADGAGSTPGADHVGLHASVQQQRLDVGTRRIGVELTADSRTAVHVTAVQLLTDAFASRPATAKDTAFSPGATIDLVIEYGDPVCDQGVSVADAKVEVGYDVDGRSGTTVLPVDDRGRGLLDRLHESGCAHETLVRAASIDYRLPFHRERVDGVQALVGALTLTRPADGGSGDRVEVQSLLGSVLFDFLPLTGRVGSWGRLAPGDDTAVLPVEIRSSDLCTQHGRSQSQQTFVWSAYVRVGDHPVYRQIIEPPTALQNQANALLDDVCGE